MSTRWARFSNRSEAPRLSGAIAPELLLEAERHPPRDLAAAQLPQNRLGLGERARGHLAMDLPSCPHRQNLAQIFPCAHRGSFDLNLASRHKNCRKRDILCGQSHPSSVPVGRTQGNAMSYADLDAEVTRATCTPPELR